jgi:hypothetical protein
LSSQRIIPAPGDIETLAEALDAGYEYERFLLCDVDPNYDYLRNVSDWIDRQLLYYLADPAMHLVTNDRKIKARCLRSKQSIYPHSLDLSLGDGFIVCA